MTGRLESIPFFVILIVVVSAIIIYFIFFLIDKYYVVLTKKGKEFYFIKSLSNKIMLIVWFIWFLCSVYYLLLFSPIITLIFLTGFYLFTKDFWVNIYSGILLILNGKIKKGDYIYFPELAIEGTVNKLMLLEIEMTNSDEELLYIPYGKVLNTIFVIKEKVSSYYLNEFEIRDNDFNTKLNEDIIKKVLLLCPWTVLSKRIEIDRIGGGYKIKTISFNKKMAVYQKEFMIRELQKI